MIIIILQGKRKPEILEDEETQSSIKFSSALMLNYREGSWSTEEEVLLQCRTGADVIVIGRWRTIYKYIS